MGMVKNMKKISENSYTIRRIIKKDSKGKYIEFQNKKIRFDNKFGLIETPYNLDNRYYIQDYRAYDGYDVGKLMILQITKKY